MNIRKCMTKDLEKFLEHGLFLKRLEESFGFEGYVEDEEKFIREYSRFLVMAFENDAYRFYVAEDDNGNILGTLISLIEPTETFYRYRLLGRILTIWIEDGNREQGVAKALVEACEDEMLDTGIDVVYATINQWNNLPQYKLSHHGYHYEYVQLFRRLT